MLHDLNEAVRTIEEHLLEDDPLAFAERRLVVPRAHFRVVFQSLAGITPAEYVRRRRLALAGEALIAGMPVTEAAHRCGYASVDGFSRAYRSWAGCMPSETMRSGVSRGFSPILFVVSVKGGSAMEYRIERLSGARLAGVCARVPLQFEGVNQAIVELAKGISPEQREELHRLMDAGPRRVLNASWDSDTDFREESGELTHMIGVLTSQDEVGAGLVTRDVPEGDWAAFPFSGPFPEALQETTARIYGEWLSSSGWLLADSLILSFTEQPDAETGEAKGEVWVPVVRDEHAER